MGRVYSVAEIQTGRVPESPLAHMASRDELLGLIDDAIRSGEQLHGALVYGSVAAEVPTIRSDLDVLIAYYDLSVLQGLRDIFNTIYERHHVAVEPNIWPTSALANGSHTIDPAFRQHLLAVSPEGNLVGTSNPAELIETGPISAQVMFAYLSHKIRSLTGGYMEYDHRGINQKPLQRALELPVSVGRKFLTVARSEGLIDLENDSTDKQAILFAFEELFGDDQKIMSLFSSLVARNTEYSDVLDATLMGEVNTRLYQEQLRTMGRDSIRIALTWAQELEGALRALFKEKAGQATATQYRGK